MGIEHKIVAETNDIDTKNRFWRKIIENVGSIVKDTKDTVKYNGLSLVQMFTLTSGFTVPGLFVAGINSGSDAIMMLSVLCGVLGAVGAMEFGEQLEELRSERKKQQELEEKQKNITYYDNYGNPIPRNEAGKHAITWCVPPPPEIVEEYKRLHVNTMGE